MEILTDICAYIRVLKYKHGLHASIDLHDVPADHAAALMPLISHDNEYCACIKKGGRPLCWVARRAARIAAPKKPYFAVCYAGVAEWVFPIVVKGKTVDYLSVTGYRADPPDFAAVAKRTYGNAPALETAYPTLKPEIPSREEIEPVVKPLVYMLSLYRAQLPQAPDAPPVYRAMLEYLQAHYKEDFSLDAMGAALGYAADTVGRLFKKYSGKTVIAYLTELRLNAAAERLRHTDARVTDIAAAVGYNDPNYFTLCFTKRFGLSPRAYRNNRAPTLR